MDSTAAPDAHHLGAELTYRQNHIHPASCDRAVGHRAVFGFIWRLCQRQTAAFLDPSDAVRSVRARSRQDNCDRLC